MRFPKQCLSIPSRKHFCQRFGCRIRGHQVLDGQEIVCILHFTVVVETFSKHLQGGVTLANNSQAQFIFFMEEDLDRHCNQPSHLPTSLEPYPCPVRALLNRMICVMRTSDTRTNQPRFFFSVLTSHDQWIPLCWKNRWHNGHPDSSNWRLFFCW